MSALFRPRAGLARNQISKHALLSTTLTRPHVGLQNTYSDLTITRQSCRVPDSVKPIRPAKVGLIAACVVTAAYPEIVTGLALDNLGFGITGIARDLPAALFQAIFGDNVVWSFLQSCGASPGGEKAALLNALVSGMAGTTGVWVVSKSWIRRLMGKRPARVRREYKTQKSRIAEEKYERQD